MARLTTDQVKFNLGKIPGWRLTDDQIALTRTFSCSHFTDAIALVNRIAQYLEQDYHHAEIRILSGTVTVSLSSKEARGLTGKDFAIAQAINKMSGENR